MTARIVRRIGATSPAIALAVSVIIVTAACSDTMSPKPLTIHNTTDAAVTVEYHLLTQAGQDRIDHTIVLQPHNTQQYVWPFKSDAVCAPGTLTATIAGTEVARLEHPCEEATWEIRPTPLSS